MIYSTFGAIFEHAGPYIEIHKALLTLGFNSDINRLGPFICDGSRRVAYEVPAIPVNVEEVSEKEFIRRVRELQKEVQEFIRNLEPGSQVVICERVGDPDDYPMSFIDEMTRYSGKVMTIKHVSQNSCDGRKFSNGSNKTFYMVEDKEYYTWHSSMFELGLVNSVPHIDLTPIDINLSTIL